MTGRAGLIVVGASLAGVRTAEALRRRGYDAPITVVGGEPHLPYDRPPLSKDYLLGKVTAATEGTPGMGPYARHHGSPGTYGCCVHGDHVPDHRDA